MDKKDQPEKKRSLLDRKPVSKDSAKPVENRDDRPAKNTTPRGGEYKQREEFRGDYKGGNKRGTDDRRSGGFERREGGDRGGFKGRGGDDRRSGGFERREGGDRGGFKGRGGDDRRSGGFERREGGDRGGFKGRGGDDRRSGGFERKEGGDRGGFKGRGGDDRRSGGFERKEGGDRGGFKGRGGDDRRNASSDRFPSKERKFDKRNPWTEDEKPSAPKRIKRERIETKETQSRFGYKGSNKEFQKAGDSLRKGSDLLGSEVRLNRYIANSGMGSRREADAMILQGLVSVNGETVTELGVKVSPKDVIKVSGQRIMPEKPVYILLNKPKGYITTTSDPDERRTVMDLIDLPGKERIYPVGRLDRNTTGVLLLTNDGDLSQKLTHPSFEIKKIYRAKLHKKPSKEHMLAWVDGIELEDGYMAFSQIGFVDENDPSILGLEVHSGRNRIVRRMFEHFGYDVEALDRVLLGEFDKIKLGRGKWRFLSEKEVNYVDRIKRMKPKPFDPEELKPKTSEFDDLDWE